MSDDELETPDSPDDFGTDSDNTGISDDASLEESSSTTGRASAALCLCMGGCYSLTNNNVPSVCRADYMRMAAINAEA